MCQSESSVDQLQTDLLPAPRAGMARRQSSRVAWVGFGKSAKTGDRSAIVSMSSRMHRDGPGRPACATSSYWPGSGSTARPNSSAPTDPPSPSGREPVDPLRRRHRQSCRDTACSLPRLHKRARQVRRQVNPARQAPLAGRHGSPYAFGSVSPGSAIMTTIHTNDATPPTMSRTIAPYGPSTIGGTNEAAAIP